MTARGEVRLDDCVFIAPLYATTTIDGWQIDGATVKQAGTYEIASYTRAERRRHRLARRRYRRDALLRRHPAPVPYPLTIKINNNGVRRRIGAWIIDGANITVLAHFGHLDQEDSTP